MLKRKNAILFLLLIWALTIWGPSDARAAYYGDQYQVISASSGVDSEAGDIDAGDRISMRFTAQNSEAAVTKIWVRVDEHSNGLGTFRFGLQGDSSGEPDGTWLGTSNQAYGDNAPSGTGQLEITLTETAPLTADTVYHLVVEPVGDPGVNHLTLGCVDPSNQLYPYDSSSDTNANTLDYNITTGTTWTVLNKSPLYLLSNAGGFYEGHPYYTRALDDVFGTEYCGERFTVSGGNKSVTTIGTVVKQFDGDEPADSLYYYLYDVTGDTLVVSGTLCAGADIEPDTIYDWQDSTAFAAETLTDGNTYSLYFTSPDSLAGANYEIDQKSAYSTKKAHTYGGATNAYYIYTTDGGTNWLSTDYSDIPFRFTLSVVNTAPTNDSASVTDKDDTSYCYGGQEYTFRAVVSDTDGPNDVTKGIDTVELRFPIDGPAGTNYYNVKCNYNHGDSTSWEEVVNGNEGYAALNTGTSSTSVSSNELTVNFKITMGWEIVDGSGYDIDIQCADEGALSDTWEEMATDEFTVENDMVFANTGNITFTGATQGALTSPAWVKGSEAITVTGTTVIYEGSGSLVHPPDADFNVDVTTDGTPGPWSDDSNSDGSFSVTAAGDTVTNTTGDTYTVSIVDVPTGATGASFEWGTIKTDDDVPTNVGCNTPANNDTDVATDTALVALTASDGTGSGSVTYHIQIAEDTGFTTNKQETTADADGSWTPGITLTGSTDYYWRVKAKDAVGNESTYWAGHSADPGSDEYGHFTTAAVTAWTQTDWVGGSGQSAWSDETMYNTGTYIDDTIAGEANLTSSSSAVDYVVISEVFYDETSTDVNLFIELYNPTSDAVTLTGWYIEEWDADDVDATPHYTYNFLEAESIPAHGYYLIGQAATLTSADFDASYNNVVPDHQSTFPSSIYNTNGLLALYNGSSQYIDGLGHGTCTNPNMPQTDLPSYAEPGAGNSIERKSGSAHDDSKGNGYDTDSNSNDCQTRTPGNVQPQNSSGSTEDPPSAYDTPGPLESSIYDAGAAGADWGTITWTADTSPDGTSVTVKVRTSDDSGMSGATAWTSCDAATSGNDISSLTGVTDTDRYIQYYLTLATTNTSNTPTFEIITIIYAAGGDTDPPEISDVTIPDVAMIVDDEVTATITVVEDTDTYTLTSGTIGGFTLGSLSKTNDTTYTATFTIADNGTDVAAGSTIPVANLVLTDTATNPSTAYETPISQVADPIDANLPNITAVSIPNEAMIVDDVVTATITIDDDGTAVGTTLTSGTIGGFTLSNLQVTNNTTLTADFTVTDNGTDVAAGSDIPIADLIVADAATNPSNTWTTAISQAADPIDANLPNITAVSIPNTAMIVDDVVTATITIDDDGTAVGTTLTSGTIGGFTLSNLQVTNNTTLTADFTVTDNGTDVAAGSTIPIADLIVADAATNPSNTWTTAIDQAADPIDANLPNITAVSIPNTAMIVDDEVTATITIDDDGTAVGTTLTSGTIGGFTLGVLAVTNNTTLTATFTIADGGSDVAAVSTIPIADLIVADAATNPSNTWTTAIDQLSDPIDANLPTVDLSDDHADLIVRDADTVVITATFSENMTSAPTISIDVSTGTDADISDAVMSGADDTWTYSWDVPAGHSADTATVDVAGTDIATNAYAGSDEIVYTIDNTAPTAAITYSPDRAVKSGETLRITATFDEAMVDSPVTKVAISGANTLDPPENMTKTDTTHYYYDHTVGAGNGTATVALSAGTDVAGNVITSLPTGDTETFTVDNTAPTVSPPFDPADNAPAVAISANLVITFNESVDTETGNFSIYDSTDTLFEDFNVADSLLIEGSGTSEITINPTDNMAASTSYYVQIAATCFDDTASNSYAGIGDKTTWNFTTTGTIPAGGLLINEVAFKETGSTDWVEIYCVNDGNSGGGVNVRDYYLNCLDPPTAYHVFGDDDDDDASDHDVTICTGEYIVVHYDDAAAHSDESSATDGVLNLYSDDTTALVGTDEQSVLYNSGATVIDAVCWSDNDGTIGTEDDDVKVLYDLNPKQWIHNPGTDDSAAFNAACWINSDYVAPSKSIGRNENSTDNNSKTDWHLYTTIHTKGARNGSIVINEVLYDPTGVDTGLEWIELFNDSGSDIVLTGYDLRGTTAAAQYYTFPTFTLDPGDYVVVHWRTAGTDGVPEKHLYTGTVGFTSNLANTSDAVALFNSSTRDGAHMVDFIQYGSGTGETGEASALTAGIWDDNDYITVVATASSIARIPNGTGSYNGYDNNQPADFQEATTPTPGATNSAAAAATTVTITNWRELY